MERRFQWLGVIFGTLLLTLLLAVMGSSQARADDDGGMGPNAWDAPFSVELHIGAYGPVGGIGGAVMVTPSPYFSLTAGVGGTVSGWRVGTGLRLFYPISALLGVGVESWYSYGTDRRPFIDVRPLYSDPGWMPSYAEWEGVHSLRVVATIEIRLRRGFRARFYFGGAGTLSCGAASCDGLPATTPALGFAVGWAFGGSGRSARRRPRPLPNEDGDELTPPRRPTGWR